MTVKTRLTSLVGDERGSTAIEYGLIAALMVIVAISAMNGVADENTGLWARVSKKSAEAHGMTP